MSKLIAAIHGILTGQTDPSWPDRLDAWMFRRDPQAKVLKKEYSSGPFPRWNCWVKDPLLARSLANEIALFSDSENDRPSIWFLAHSNGAVIALLTAGLLIERGFKIDGLILTGAACESDIERSGVLGWQGRGRLGMALAYSSQDDEVLPSLPENAGGNACWSHTRQWLWGKLVWPYGGLGRTGWTLNGQPLSTAGQTLSTIQTRWYSGGHSAYFTAQNSERTFEQFYQDIQTAEPRTVSRAIL